MTCLLCTFLEEKIGILQLRLVASMRTYMEQKVQPFAFGCSFEPHEYFWIIFCLEKSNPPPSSFFPVCKALALSFPGPAMAEQPPCVLMQAELEVTLIFHPCELSQPHITQGSKPSLLPWHLGQEVKGTLDPASRQNPKYSSFTRCAVGISQLWERGTGTTPGQNPQDKNHPGGTRVHLDGREVGKHSGV